jgi:NAD(P)-dependent dehydrogenase (short-subunit alcohol dehydrogenase family)
MYSDLKGKTALITGASLTTGIGFGIARSLAENGMDIILSDLPCEGYSIGKRPIDQCCDLLKHEYGVKALALEMDVTIPHDVDKAVSTTKNFCSTLHALINNAGANMGPTRVGDYDPALWFKVLDINLMGPFRLIQAFLPLMITGSSIVNIASRAGKRPLPTCSAYSTSKAGLIMLTKCVAVEYAAMGIRANALCPGQILTEMNLRRYTREAAAHQTTREDIMAKAIATVPMGRSGTPEDVGRTAAFLVSEASGYITGQALNVTGGQIMEL